MNFQDHPLQDESEEHGQDGGQPLKPEEHGQDGGPPLKPEEHDLDGRDPLETKKSTDDFKRTTSSNLADQDHGVEPPRELEELNQDEQSAPRLNDKISTYEVACVKISSYEAHLKAYDDSAAPCA
jgi:hypothetical protein